LNLREELLSLNFEKTIEDTVNFIRDIFKESGVSGVVLGLSGGVDSSLAATLCVQALGAEKILGVLMPTYFTPEEDVKDAYSLAEMLGIETLRVNISGIVDSFSKAIGARKSDPKMKMPFANLRARIRMITLYFFANARSMLVAGTSDLSELLIGFFTKYGDGAADFLPIAHLYKTQVREISRHLGIPSRIASKPSSPQLYPGHRLLDEIPIDYEELDPVLLGLFKYRLTPEEVSRETSVPLNIILDVKSRFENSRHKGFRPG